MIEQGTVIAKLGLGGHSYIQHLGNDPQPTFEEQCAIVSRCLDGGVRLFDTTYYQERVALGKILQHLGRRDEATLTAWNFFKQPGKEDGLVGFTPYEPQHIDAILAELQTSYVDMLVIHAHNDWPRLQQERELAQRWVAQGKVRQIGLGMAGPEHMEWLAPEPGIAAVFTPYNAFVRQAADVFAVARQCGLRTMAMSPFIRGWKLDEIGEGKREAAQILLRWVATQPLVDVVIVSMRKPEWVEANLRAVELGPLTSEEQTRLDGWVSRLS